MQLQLLHQFDLLTYELETVGIAKTQQNQLRANIHLTSSGERELREGKGRVD